MNVESYVREYAGSFLKVGHAPIVELFVLKHGHRFKPASLPAEFPRGAPKNCFQNSIEVAIFASRKTAITNYAEGFLVRESIGIPIHHAWNFRKLNRVVHDVTIDRPEECFYFGVEFSNEFVSRRTIETMVWGLLGTHPRQVENMREFDEGFPDYVARCVAAKTILEK